MWLFLALLAAVFSGLSSVFEKKGMTGKPVQCSAVANTVGLAVMVLAVLLSGAFRQLPSVPVQSWLLTIISGIVQAFSWIAYFMALRAAQVSVVMALDKLNVVVTMLLSYLILGEAITGWMVLGCCMILTGAMLLTGVSKEADAVRSSSRAWLFWAVLSPSLQALTNVLAKLDTSGTDSTLSTTLRTIIVVAILWSVALLREGQPELRRMLSGTAGFHLLLGGAMIGTAYLLLYWAISIGITSVVTPIMKMDLLVTTAAASLFLHERIGKRGSIGFVSVLVGVLLFLL